MNEKNKYSSYPILYNMTTKLLVTSKARRLFHGLAEADPVRMQLNATYEGSPVRKLKVLYEVGT